MNVAILVRGINYDPVYKDGINFKNSIDNFQTHIIEDLQNKHSCNKIDVYLSTYDSAKLNECKHAYKPITCVLNEYNEMSRHTTIANGLQVVIESGIIYDLVIVYRFDIRLKVKLTELPNINYSVLNIPFFSPGDWKGCKRINDGFYVFPGRLLKDIHKIFQDSIAQRQTHNHFYGKFRNILGKGNVNMLLKQTFKSQSTLQKNPLYENRL